jgi:hypothetical protein
MNNYPGRSGRDIKAQPEKQKCWTIKLYYYYYYSLATGYFSLKLLLLNQR